MFRRSIFFVLFFIPGSAFCQGTWVQKANPFAAGRAGAVGFSIGSKGYLGTGWQYNFGIYYNDFWEWDQASNVWTQKANFPGTARGDGSGFSIGAKGYIGIGTTGLNFYNDFWEWDQAGNTWTKKTNSSASGLAFGVGFSIGSKGYFGTGGSGASSDFWEWSPATNAWTQKANFGGGIRSNAVGFSINNKGYVGTGKNGITLFKDFWEYDPASNAWTQKANFPGPPRAWASGFSIGTRGYIGTGSDVSGNNIYDDFYEWDPATNTWTQKANYPHPASDIDHASFSIGCHGYFACGSNNPSSASLYFNDLWEYTPDNLSPVVATISGNSTICAGSPVSLSAAGGTYYSWNTGDSTSVIVVTPGSTTTYSVTVSTDCGSASTAITIVIIQKGAASFTYDYDPCKNSCVQFSDQSANAFSWCWDMGDGTNQNTQAPCWAYADSGTYNVGLIVNCNTGCADTFSLQVPYVAGDTSAMIYVPNAFSPNGDDENDVLNFQVKNNSCFNAFLITIYDRWGEKVYETTDILQGWDGKYNSENENSGVYAYCLQATLLSGKEIKKKGNVSLIR